MMDFIIITFLLGIIFFTFPSPVWAHGDHKGIMSWLNSLWEVIRLKYWGLLTWTVLAIIIGLIIFFIILEIKERAH